jgi:hypothetical protein
MNNNNIFNNNNNNLVSNFNFNDINDINNINNNNINFEHNNQILSTDENILASDNSHRVELFKINDSKNNYIDTLRMEFNLDSPISGDNLPLTERRNRNNRNFNPNLNLQNKNRKKPSVQVPRLRMNNIFGKKDEVVETRGKNEFNRVKSSSPRKKMLPQNTTNNHPAMLTFRSLKGGHYQDEILTQRKDDVMYKIAHDLEQVAKLKKK